jgi:DNA-binding NarL/FixJ family response regulator
MSDSRTVLLVEDDHRQRELVTDVLSDRGLRVTAVPFARDALARLQEIAPDVVVVDLGLPDLDGVDLIRMIRERHPSLPIIVLTVATSEARILAALRAGAAGYLFKEDAGRRLATAILDAFDGGSPMSPAVAQLVLAQIRTPHAPQPEQGEGLTARERDVIGGIARGLTYEEVATTLGVSINTVRSHIRVIYDKLDASTKTEAVLAALRRGLLSE